MSHRQTTATVYCPNCGYDLSWTETDECPECGGVFDREAILNQRDVTVPVPKWRLIAVLFPPIIYGPLRLFVELPISQPQDVGHTVILGLHIFVVLLACVISGIAAWAMAVRDTKLPNNTRPGAATVFATLVYFVALVLAQFAVAFILSGIIEILRFAIGISQWAE